MPQEKYSRFIDEIAFQTYLLFDLNDIDQIENFRDYLESTVLEQILRCRENIKPSITTHKHSGNETSGFLKAALVGSGISEDGILPFGYNYAVESLDNLECKLSEHAIKRYREIEDEYYYENYSSIALSLISNCVQSEYVDIEETLKAFFYLNDRTTSMIFDLNAFYYKEAVIWAWKFEKKMMTEQKLDDSICYRICDEVCETNRHFSFIERNALTAIALADFRLHTDGDVSEVELERIKALSEAAKEEGSEMVSRYEEEFSIMFKKDCKSLGYKRKN